MKFLIFLSFLSLALSNPFFKYSDSPVDIIENIFEFQRGVFEAWSENGESVQKLLACNKNVRDVYMKLLEIVNIIKAIDWMDVKNVLDSFKLIADEFSAIFSDLLLCVDSKEELMILLERIIHLSPTEFISRIYSNFLANGQKITQDIKEGFDAIIRGDYYTAGYCFGEILELLIFKTLPKDLHYRYIMKKVQHEFLPYN